MNNKIDCTEIETMINYYKNKDENKKTCEINIIFDCIKNTNNNTLFQMALKENEHG